MRTKETTDAGRSAQRTLRATGLVLSMEPGDRVTIGPPENIAFDPAGASPDFYVISVHIRLFGTFDAVSSVATADSIEHLA